MDFVKSATRTVSALEAGPMLADGWLLSLSPAKTSGPLNQKRSHRRELSSQKFLDLKNRRALWVHDSQVTVTTSEETSDLRKKLFFLHLSRKRSPCQAL